MIFIHVPFLAYSATAIFPFILIREKSFRYNAVLVNHERIHFRQQLELLLLPFYLLYLFNYIFNLLRFRNHHRAYREIIFEREAYRHETERDYLKGRKFWAFLRER